MDVPFTHHRDAAPQQLLDDVLLGPTPPTRT
jgi:hypothetical protein